MSDTTITKNAVNMIALVVLVTVKNSFLLSTYAISA